MAPSLGGRSQRVELQAVGPARQEDGQRRSTCDGNDDSAPVGTCTTGVGLVLGKTIGITAAALAGRRAGDGRFPTGVDARHVVGVAAWGGIGFTVALFIATLAFDDAVLQADAKIGILAGSLVSGLMGALMLFRAPAETSPKAVDDAAVPVPS